MLTILDLKKNIEEWLKVPSSSQKILFKGRILGDDNETLEKASITPNAKIMLMEKVSVYDPRIAAALKGVSDELTAVKSSFSDVKAKAQAPDNSVYKEILGVSSKCMLILESADAVHSSNSIPNLKEAKKELTDEILQLLDELDKLKKEVADKAGISFTNDTV